jgi:hypothetical protein
MRHGWLLLALSVSCSSPGTHSVARSSAPAPRSVHETEVIFLATPQVVAEQMLRMGGVTSRDTIYEPGCGDGRILIMAALEVGARGVGIEIHPQRAEQARADAARAGVAHLVTILQGDMFDVDLSPATVVVLYLYPDLNSRLVPQLQRLARGARIVSHDFGIGDLPPDLRWSVQGPEYDGSSATRTHELMLWRTPFKTRSP